MFKLPEMIILRNSHLTADVRISNMELRPKMINQKAKRKNNKTAFQSKEGHPQMCVVSCAHLIFSSCDLDLDPMTMMLHFDA